MPFLSSFGGASNFGFGLSRNTSEQPGGGGGDQPYTGTMYYYEGTDESDTTSTWASLAKWFKDQTHTQPASALPTASNATVLLNNTSADLETWTAPASIDISSKTLTLNAHAIQNGCASAKEFDTTVTASSSSNLVLNGHINITGINHTEYTYVSSTDTYYYFDSDIGLNDYIYQNQYSNTVAAVAITFAIEQNGNFFDITTDSTGKVTAKEGFTLNPPPNEDIFIRNANHEQIIARIVFNSRFAGYYSAFCLDECPPAETDPQSIAEDNTDAFKLFFPSGGLVPTNTKPVYVLATRNENTGVLNYVSPPQPYSGSFSYHSATVNGVAQYKLVTTDTQGQIISVITCD